MTEQVRYLDETGEGVVTSFQWPDSFAGLAAQRAGIAVGAGTTSVLLDAGYSQLDGAYKGMRVGLLTDGQVRAITKYTGVSRRAQVDAPWGAPPASGTSLLVTDARRFAIQNVGDADLTDLDLPIRPVGFTDGWQYIRIAADSQAIVPPFALGAALSAPGASGTWAATGVRYYRLSATNATGETNGSLEVSVDVDDTTELVTLTWDPLPGATKIRIYRSETPGVYTNALLAELNGNGTTYLDHGGAVGAGSLPADNRTGGGPPFYGTPPALGAGPLTIATLRPGQQVLFWLGWEIPAGLTSAGNPRQGKLAPQVT